MKKYSVKEIGLILAVALAVVACVQFVRASRQRNIQRELAGRVFIAKDYYPLAVKNQWTYEVRDEDEIFPATVSVAAQEKWNGHEVYKVMFEEQAYKLLGYSDVGLVKFKEYDHGEEERYDPHGVILPDMVYNQTRTFHPKYVMQFGSAQGSYQAEAEMSFWIESLETVKVPAGTFSDCLKVGYYDRWEEEDGSYDISRGEMWFAKGVGIVKLIGNDSQVEPNSGFRETNKEVHVLLSYDVQSAEKAETQ